MFNRLFRGRPGLLLALTLILALVTMLLLLAQRDVNTVLYKDF